MKAFQDISSNPANISKYQNNPKVQALLEKMGKKFGGGMGGAGGPFGGAGAFGGDEGPFGDSGSTAGSTSSSAPPQPDID